MAILKKRLGYKNPNGSEDFIHFETSADIVLTADGSTVEEKLSKVADVVEEKLVPIETAVNQVDVKIANAITESEEKTSTTINNSVTEVRNDITAIQSTLTELAGDGEGSVKDQIAAGIAAIVDDAPEAFDTLKEFADWIVNHETDALAMNTAIQGLKTSLTALEARVQALEDNQARYTFEEV